MKFLKQLKIPVIAGGIILVIGIVGIYGFPLLLKGKLTKTLQKHGFKDPVITGLDHRRSEVMFTDIYLDDNGFSKIGSVRARLNWPGLFFSSRPFSELIVDDLAITIEFPQDVYSWQEFDPAAFIPLTGTSDITINGATLDLVTESGALTFSLKGNIQSGADKQTGKKKKTVTAVVWGDQYKTIIDSHWTIDLYADRSWKSDAKINDLRLKFDTLNLSRGTGWLAMENTTPEKKPPISNVSGQFQLGGLRLGNDLHLSNITLSFNGPAQKIQTIITAQSPVYSDINLSAEILYDTTVAETISVDIAANDLDHLFAFVTDMKENLQGITSFGDSLTSLLITPGNLERIRKSMGAQSYDRFTLHITGTTYDLSGKIVAVKSGADSDDIEVYSMNPGTAE